MTHLQANLGWVDLDSGCSTILPSCSVSSAKFPPAQTQPGRGWNSQNQSQPNRGLPGDWSPCSGVCTGMVKKVGPRLRDPASWLPLVAGASSYNLGPTYFTIPVQVCRQVFPCFFCLYVHMPLSQSVIFCLIV